MKNYISSEYLKHKNTFAKKLVWLAPILTLCLNVLTPMWYQQNSYNWWYVFLYPGCLTLLSILIIQRDNGKLKCRAILSLPVDLKKVWYAKIITCIIYIVLANTILMLCNVAGGFIIQHIFDIPMTISPMQALFGTLCIILASCHDAIQRVNKHIMADKVNYILDADIKGFFDNLDHEWMIKFLEHDIADKNFIRYIKRFLIGGVMEDGKRLDTEAGTVQGGLISPVLANVYLHYTLDTWFDYVKKHEFKGEMYMVRYADDFVCLFQYENEAQRFYQLLIERLRKFGLEITEDKSRILPFGRYKGTKESFDFLGFTHYNATSHWGKYCVLHRTSRKKLKMKREAVKKWLWEHMHESIADTIEALNVKLTGHYRYYGIYGNYIGLQKYYKYVRQELWKSKRRRDQTYWLTWKKYMNILKIHPMEYPRIYLKSAY